MRTNIDFNDELLEKTIRMSGEKTKKGAVEAAMRFFVQIKGQEGIRRLRGKVEGDWNLEESRLGRFADID